MDSLDNPTLRTQLQDFIKQRDDTLTWVETHGLLCAMATGPAAVNGWQDAIFVEDELTVPDAMRACMAQLVERLASDLGAGDAIALPCRLDPYEDNEGYDLVSWCTGFMAGVFSNEEAWYAGAEEKIVNLLLPFLLISGLEEDEELDALWDNTRLTRQMALGIPSLLEELFLHFHAPDLPDNSSNDEEE
jgi:uncharacterized protein